MPPDVAAGNCMPYAVPWIVSFLPPAMAMQQFCVLNGAMASIPSLLL